ncbi:MAG: glucan biosynthesis protein, partial [bacterium]
DFRPEVHDSDGLQLLLGNGERVWRPLNNQTFTRNSSFLDRNPRGFGLLQRERRFQNYQDLEANYHLRPSVWVEPVGDWGKGAVRLAELYAADETVDNIAAFWVPEKAPKAGEELEFAYRLNWFIEAKKYEPPTARVVATHYAEFVLGQPDQRLFILDFDSRQLAALAATAKVEPVVTVGEGAELVHAYACKNPHNANWRVGLTIRLKPATLRAIENHTLVAQMNHTLAMTDRFTAPLRGVVGREGVLKGAESFAAATVQYRTSILPAAERPVIELRCFLRSETEALSETWSYRWNP